MWKVYAITLNDGTNECTVSSAMDNCIYRYLYSFDKQNDIMGIGMVDVVINIVIIEHESQDKRRP